MNIFWIFLDILWTKFTDDFLEYLTSIMPELSNIIVLGDFNIHYNNILGMHRYLRSQWNLFGFDQHVKSATHVQGNVLDLIFTESEGQTLVKNCLVTDLVSDHALIVCELNTQRDNVTTESVNTRKLKNIDIDSFKNDIIMDFELSDDLNDLGLRFNLLFRETITCHQK